MSKFETMKVGQLIKHQEYLPEVPLSVSYSSGFDNDLYKKGMKRVGPIAMRRGYDSDDFMRGLITLSFTATAYRIPRILNPIYKNKRK
jgi:hypothetical protein